MEDYLKTNGYPTKIDDIFWTGVDSPFTTAKLKKMANYISDLFK